MRAAERNGWWAGPLPTLVLPLAVGAFTVVGTFRAAEAQPFARPLDALGVALLLAGAVALVVRRRYPAGVLGVAAAAVWVYLGLDYPYGPVFLAGLVAMCSAVISRHRRRVRRPARPAPGPQPRRVAAAVRGGRLAVVAGDRHRGLRVVARPPGAAPAGAAGGGGGRGQAWQRGEAAHRPRPARLARPPRQPDQCAGRRGT